MGVFDRKTGFIGDVIVGIQSMLYRRFTKASKAMKT